MATRQAGNAPGIAKVTFRVELESRARREYLALPKEAQQLLGDTLDDLREAPRPPGAKRLKGVDGFRIRRGNYRILYTIDDRARLVRIYRIGHRRNIYRGL